MTVSRKRLRQLTKFQKRVDQAWEEVLAEEVQDRLRQHAEAARIRGLFGTRTTT